MSESSIVSNDGVSDVPIIAITAGSLLRAAREREGLHVAALAVSMKVPVKKLEALEANRLDLLPDAVFVRALASSVCRALKVDPTKVLELLPASNPPRLNPDGRGVNTPFPGIRKTKSGTMFDSLGKPTGLVVSMILLAALAVHFSPEMPGQAMQAEASSDKTSYFPPLPSNEVESTAAAVDRSIQSNSNLTMSPGADLANRSVNAEQAVPPLASEVSKSATSDISGNRVVTTVQVKGAVPAITFKAQGGVWIQVTDAHRVQLLSKTLSLGEVIEVSGALPLAVIVGRADMISVQVRGQDFDLTGVSQNNVARFEVKP